MFLKVLEGCPLHFMCPFNLFGLVRSPSVSCSSPLFEADSRLRFLTISDFIRTEVILLIVDF